jgi:DNA-binding phage protein
MQSRHIPGPDAQLPDFIVQRMVDLNMRPTLSQLAFASGVNLMTLQRNLRGEREMKLSTANKLKTALDLDSIDELINHMPFLATD